MPTMVLSVTQARPNLPELIKRVGTGEEIHMGARHEDQATLIASDALADLKRLALIAQRFMQVLSPEVIEQVIGAVQAHASADPWAGLKYSMRNGLVATSAQTATAPARAFARTPSSDEGTERVGATWMSMAARGNRGTGNSGAAEPRRPFRPSASHSTR